MERGPRRGFYERRHDRQLTAACRLVLSILLANERLLTKRGRPVELGARALDILIVLISSPNEIVSKKDLMSRVWPDVIVEEGSLRFHMAGLRKALGDGQDDARYITTFPGRGYCFVAPVSRPASPPDDTPVVASNFPHANLPSRLSRVVGRDEDVLRLSAQLNASRFVTIVGAGGVGKTTVAIAVGHHLIDAFSGALLFVDLGMLGDPELVTAGMASMLGLSVQSNDATPNLIAYLRNKRILLILDTCEHLVEAVAPLAASIIDAAPQVHILATSREALRVEGEHIYRLDALACPPDDPGLTAAVVRTFPAIAAVRGARGGKWRAFGRQRRGSPDRRKHLPKARRSGARNRAGGQTRRILWTATNRSTSRSTSDPAVAGVANRATASKNAAGHAGLELWAPDRTGACGASQARRIRWPFHPGCGAGSRHQCYSRQIERSWRHR